MRLDLLRRLRALGSPASLSVELYSDCIRVYVAHGQETNSIRSWEFNTALCDHARFGANTLIDTKMESLVRELEAQYDNQS